MKIVAYVVDRPDEMTVVRSMDQYGLGTKIPSDYKVETDQSKRLYRVYEHTVATYANAPQNFKYITVKGQVYKVHFENGKPARLSKHVGLFGY